MKRMLKEELEGLELIHYYAVRRRIQLRPPEEVGLNREGLRIKAPAKHPVCCNLCSFAERIKKIHAEGT